MQRKKSLAFVVSSTLVASLLVATLGLSILMSGRVALSSAQVDQTMRANVAVAELLGTLLEAETGQRGYVLTARAEYLEPYVRARSIATARVERLRLLSTDDATQRARVAEVARLTAVKLDELQQVIERRDHDGRDAAIALIDTDMGLHTMDALRNKLDAMETAEVMLLTARRERQQRDESLVLVSLVVASISFGLGAGLIALWQRTAEARRRSLESDEARLRSENDVLAERQRTAELQERFAGIVGHDLRNPLSAMTMGIELLRRQSPSSTSRALDRMASSAARMSRMIEQLLDLTRSRIGGGIAVMRAPMNLGTLVAELADEARAAHPGHELVVDATGDLGGAWDSDRLGQVISNLVGNAMVHGTLDAPVTVTVRGAADTVEVDVHSEGEPIPAAIMESLFDPFRRGVRARETSSGSGLGLGLYITREILAAHGGAVDVISPDAGGTTFHVVLPRASTTSAQGAHA